MKKILHVISSLSVGGIESLVVELYKNIDCEKFQFDFAVWNPNNPIHEETLKKLGANIVYIADAGCHKSIYSKVLWRVKGIINYIKLIFKNEKYDGVHLHIFGSYHFYVLLAAIRGIPIRIVHSHTAGGLKETWLKKFFRRIKNVIGFEWLITHKVGCSDVACRWLYGDKNFKRNKTKTIYNGIDMNKFSKTLYFLQEEYLRKKYAISKDMHNFIHVGRFDSAKNQFFLIDIFNELYKTRKDIKLYIIGFGSIEEKLKNKVKNLELENNIIFLPHDTNIPEILSVADYFLLPSLWEGLPITIIEAQSMGLQVFISNKVTREIEMGLCMWLPIDEGVEPWINSINNRLDSGRNLKEKNYEITKKFDIKNIAKEFEKIYAVSFLGG